MKKLLMICIASLILLMMIACAETSTRDTTSTTDTTTTNVDLQDYSGIVFYSGREGNNEIYIINRNESTPTNLTNNPADDECPAPSPNGMYLAFTSNRDGMFNLYRMTIYGTSVIKLTESDVDVTQPSWSNDGSKLLYVLDYGSRTEIWQMDSDGANPIRLTNNPFRDERPVFSPDMNQIMFMSNRDGHYRIYIMDVNGSNQTRFDVVGVDATRKHFVFPQYSSDGNHIIYSLNDTTNMQAVIHKCKTDGSDDVLLTESGGRNENPSFSKNGNWIVFQSERDGNFEIYLMSSDGENVTRMTNDGSWDGWPSFYLVEAETTD